MNAELILESIDKMFGLSEKYPDQLFDVVSTTRAVVLESTAGEKFQVSRNSLTDKELFLIDTELSKTSEMKINLIYRTSHLEDADDSESEYSDSALEDSMSEENEMDIIQRLDSVERENKKFCYLHSSSKEELKDFLEMWADENAMKMKNCQCNMIQTRMDEIDRKVNDLSGVLNTLKIKRRESPDEEKTEDGFEIYPDHRNRYYNYEELEYEALSDEDVTDFKSEENGRDFRKRKYSDEVTEMCKKKQKLDRRKAES